MEQHWLDSLFRLCQVSYVQWPFKLDDNSSPRGNVEGRHSRPCLYLNCLLLAGRCLSNCISLAICVSGRFVRGWYQMLQCAMDCFDPFELFTLMIFGLYGQLAELNAPGRAILPKVVCFIWIC